MGSNISADIPMTSASGRIKRSESRNGRIGIKYYLTKREISGASNSHSELKDAEQIPVLWQARKVMRLGIRKSKSSNHFVRTKKLAGLFDPRFLDD
jgi:hypothetical protein